MTDINQNLKTVCSFYVSDWHLATMLLPNIDKKINEGVKITTIFENNFTEKMELLLEKLALQNKQKILDIKWDKKDLENINIKNIIINNDEIIINGSIEYINKIHEEIDKYFSNTEETKDKHITIIDCYDIDKYEGSVRKILNNHEKILNTAGEKDKSEYITNIKIAK